MLYIMRHGKTDWNARQKLQGQTDIPLNDEGREMAEKARIEYENIHFDVCYCSPLVRATETAEIVLRGRNIPIITDKRLMEISFGVYEGIEKYLDIPDCPVNTLFFEPEKYETAVEGGENIEELFSRTGSFLSEVIEPELALNKDIIIIGHGVMNSSIICQVKNREKKDLWSESIENCRLKHLI